MNYQQFVLRLSRELGGAHADVDPSIIVPAAIEFAESRIGRDLNLLWNIERVSGTLTSGIRLNTIPSLSGGRAFSTVNGINVLVGNVRNPLTPVSIAYIDKAWPSVTIVGVPNCFAMLSDQSILVGPTPDGTYTFEVTGAARPAVLSASNTTASLWTFLPDLAFAAAMIMAGAPPSVPQWEQRYQGLLTSAATEEARRKLTGSASPASPPAAPPPGMS